MCPGHQHTLCHASVWSLVMLGALGALGCGSSAIRRFPLREPLTQDTDRRPVSVACHKAKEGDDPDRSVCTPRVYVSPFAWDAADNTAFLPASRFLAFEEHGEAMNANALDEVADSSWFENRIGQRPQTPQEITIGQCSGDLDVNMPDGSWVIDKGKTDGATPGFRVKLPKLGKFMLKADFSAQPERPSAASAIAGRLYHAVGFNVPCDSVVYFKPSLLKLNPGLKVTDNSGTSRPFDQKALDEVLASTPHRGEMIRMQSSQWLSGLPLGPFKYEGVREDDPNDVVPHEERRELRGAKLLAAWLNHFDAREQNTMITWMAADAKRPDSSPGYTRHYYLDLSDCFGSEWDWDGISRRLGFSYYFDFADVGEDFLTLGLIERPWQRAHKNPAAPIFGYYRTADFEPEKWKPGYPNPAFNKMTEADGAWMTRILARITPEHLATLVKVGQFTNPAHERYLLETLIGRHRRILRRFLGVLSPVTDLGVGADGLCGVDLARSTGTFDDRPFTYQASVQRIDASDHPQGATPLTARSLDGGKVCVDIHPEAPDSGPAPDDFSRYRVVELRNGQAPGVLRAHLYDLGPRAGLKLVGIERPTP